MNLRSRPPSLNQADILEHTQVLRHCGLRYLGYVCQRGYAERTAVFVQQPQEGQKPGEQGQPDGQQEGQKPGEKRDGKPDGKGEQPMGGTENKDGGQNKVGNNPPNSATGPGQPGTGDGGWGDLQPYLNFLRNRGASPKVPEKFRKYYEAYLKRKGKDGKK